MTQPDESAPSGIDQDELEAQAGEPLPDREAMSLIALDDAMVMPPPEEGPDPPEKEAEMQPHPRYEPT